MRKRVLLLSMPFGSLARPALGISLLKQHLSASKIQCDLKYLNFLFAEFVGYEEYDWIVNTVPYTAFAGDWAFTESLYGPRPHNDRDYVQRVLRQTWQMSEADIQRVQRVADHASRFIDYCMQTIPWNDYAVVGFTSTFEQNIASLALASRVKSEFPKAKIVFGGANWEAEMGEELHRKFPFIDFVCSGEADASFLSLVKRILRGRSANGIRGVVRRRQGTTVSNGPPDVVTDMDALPIPNYSDYFDAIAQSPVGTPIVPTLLMETSRGCWWGAKSHCTFCGLNGSTMKFRSKSAARALQELTQLTGRWNTGLVDCVDNILDMKYFRDFLPSLADSSLDAQLFYEVKANLSRDQVELLSRAGVRRIQPGIESLSDHVLKLMRKGTTALRNIQLLKWGRQFDVSVDWNILYGFPGETREDYQEIMGYLPAIRFLQPPCACGPVRLDRFSPYYDAPQTFGMINVRPLLTYQFLYPFPQSSLRKIAYYFEYDYESEVDPSGFADEVIAWTDHWRQNPERGSLQSVVRNDAMVLVDTRSNATISSLVMRDLEREAYEFCDAVRSGTAVVRRLRESFPDREFEDQHVIEFLDSMVANRLMVSNGTDYLSLAIAAKPVATSTVRHRHSALQVDDPTPEAQLVEIQ